MFYKEEDVLLFLNCPRCKNRYTDARILPCSETICVNCIETLNVNGEFTCPFCKKKHNGDFVQNKLIMSMLKIRSDNVIRDPLVEELKQKTTQLESLMEQLEKSIKSLEIEVYEHCSLIRNQIDLAAEKRKVQIDEIRFKFLTQVDDYEKQCVQNLKEYKIDGRYKEFEKSLKMHIDECREMLKNFRIDEAQVNKETEVTTSKIKEIEAFLIELKHVQFKGEVLKFTEQTFTFTDQDDRILGCINRKKITENSIHHPTPFLAFAQQPGAPPAGLPTTLSNQQATGPAAALAVLTKLQFAAVTAAQRQRPVDTYMQHQQQQQQQQQSQALPNPNQHQHHSNQSNQPHPQPQNNPMHHPAHRPPYSHMPGANQDQPNAIYIGQLPMNPQLQGNPHYGNYGPNLHQGHNAPQFVQVGNQQFVDLAPQPLAAANVHPMMAPVNFNTPNAASSPTSAAAASQPQQTAASSIQPTNDIKQTTPTPVTTTPTTAPNAAPKGQQAEIQVRLLYAD